MITLADGTQVAESYDFNVKYGILPVYNQGTSPICWREQWALHLSAFRRMYDSNNSRIAPLSFTYQAAELGFDFTLADGTVIKTHYSGRNYWDDHLTLSRPDAIKRALWLNGVAQMGVSCAHVFNKTYMHGPYRSAPLLHADAQTDADVARNNWAHSILAVGYRPSGVVIQNSWGKRFGHNGRAVLGWGLVEKACQTFLVDAYNDHPLDGLSHQSVGSSDAAQV